jgi:hypothetical protein
VVIRVIRVSNRQQQPLDFLQSRAGLFLRQSRKFSGLYFPGLRRIFQTVNMSVEQIAEEALSLPSEARVLLADRLVESLDSVEDEKIHRLWAVEALRRRDEVRSGRVKTIPGDKALARVRKAVAR